MVTKLERELRRRKYGSDGVRREQDHEAVGGVRVKSASQLKQLLGNEAEDRNLQRRRARIDRKD
jgi:hypothetical protein